MALLEVKNLKTYYKTLAGSVKAVDDVSFTLKKGEVLGLAGESGCGKTTTCLSIMRMIQPPGQIVSGQILYEKAFDVIKEDDIEKLVARAQNRPYVPRRTKDLLELTEEEMRSIRGKHISMIFQGAMNALNPVHRVGNQIMEVLNIHEPGMDKEEKWERTLDILETVGIDSSRAKDYPHQLSGGMKQRALIAMALIDNPDIVIADEPVTALDVIVQSQVLKATKELQRKFNLSMIMITHDLSVIAEVCETLAIMYAGKIVEYGDLSTLFKEPLHPYTQALINAFPSIVGPKKELFEIGGIPPDLRNPPSGCRFHPRCPKAMDICKIKEPVLTKTKNGYVACHLYQ
ncbi:MAG: ABC transporter ATP-binding protein [Candidatus Heimdallarchaeaceae archaeon]